MEFIDSAHCEWESMWAELANYPLNKGDAECRFLGAAWEYMGSTLDHHHFRHSLHPLSEKPEYMYIERRRAAVQWA